jgi:hypothetical protein
MDAHRFGVKVFAAPPVSIPIHDFVPVFHKWIQKQVVKGHLLIDVHDYSHIHHGPGILLVAHEGNFSIDNAEGRLGLMYYRKQQIPGDPEDRLTSVVQTVLEGCRYLEEDPDLGGKIRFRKDEFLVIANDRLLAPNLEQTFSEIQPLLRSALQRVLGPANIVLKAVSRDSKERLALQATVSSSNG